MVNGIIEDRTEIHSQLSTANLQHSHPNPHNFKITISPFTTFLNMVDNHFEVVWVGLKWIMKLEVDCEFYPSAIRPFHDLGTLFPINASVHRGFRL